MNQNTSFYVLLSSIKQSSFITIRQNESTVWKNSTKARKMVSELTGIRIILNRSNYHQITHQTIN